MYLFISCTAVVVRPTRRRGGGGGTRLSFQIFKVKRQNRWEGFDHPGDTSLREPQVASQPVRLKAEVVFNAQAQHLEGGDTPARLGERGGFFGRDV